MHRPVTRDARILVVEDDPLQREVLCATLAWLGYAVEEVSGGLEALARLAAADFEVVLIDWRMPGIDGVETARRARQACQGRVPPALIAWTASPQASAGAPAAGGLFDGVIRKPACIAELTRVIEDALAARILARPVRPAHSGRPALLVVDDDALQRDVLRGVLSQGGFRIDTVADGGDAVRLARARPYDAVLLDYLLPDMDGLSTARLILAAQTLQVPRPRMIAFTAVPDRVVARDADGLFDEVVAKSPDLPGLLAVIERQLQAARIAPGCDRDVG